MRCLKKEKRERWEEGLPRITVGLDVQLCGRHPKREDKKGTRPRGTANLLKYIFGENNKFFKNIIFFHQNKTEMKENANDT